MLWQVAFVRKETPADGMRELKTAAKASLSEASRAGAKRKKIFFLKKKKKKK